MRRGRLYWRSIRLRERSLAALPLGRNEYRDDLGYRDIDRNDIMAKIDSLPMGTSAKVQKIHIFPAGVDPRTQPGVIDLRA